MIFIEYPTCSTSNKAKKWMEKHGIEVTLRNIKENNPTEQELKTWLDLSSYDIKRFFNTSGKLYRELGLKDKLINMTLEEKIKILSSNGMIVKRPIVVGDDFVLVGFKEQEWIDRLL